MIKREMQKSGFALMLVLLLLAVAVVIALSYASAASIKLASSSNLNNAARARYLAESGLEHAMYLMQANFSAIQNSSKTAPLGPYTADNAGGSYRMYIETDASGPGLFYVYAIGTNNGVTQQCCAKVHRFTPVTKLGKSYSVSAPTGPVNLPSSLKITGDAFFAGSLVNSSYITGNVAATGTIQDPQNRITGTITPGSTSTAEATLAPADYQNYNVDGTSYSAIQTSDILIGPWSSFANGKAVTPTNPGGVVYVKPPAGGFAWLMVGFKFTGTIVVDGDVVLGYGVKLNNVDGFPAVVATGRIIASDLTNATISGVVSADEGMGPVLDNAPLSQTNIMGAFLSKTAAYDSSLRGSHKVTYDKNKSKVYNFSGTSGQCTVQVVSWKD